MGNHEFCTECHANDFHYGSPCDPKRKAKVDAENAVHASERERGLVLLEEMERDLAMRGVQVSIWHEPNYDTLSITGFALARAEKGAADGTKKL